MIFRIVDSPEISIPFRNYEFSFNLERDYISFGGPIPRININDEDGDLDFTVQSCYIRYVKCETLEEYAFLDKFVSEHIKDIMLFVEPAQQDKGSPMFFCGNDSYDVLSYGKIKEFAFRQMFYDVVREAAIENKTKIFTLNQIEEGNCILEGEMFLKRLPALWEE